MIRLVVTNCKGFRIGESHPRAKLKRRHVDMILELREEHGATLGMLADWFEVSKSTVRDICDYRIWVARLDG